MFQKQSSSLYWAFLVLSTYHCDFSVFLKKCDLPFSDKNSIFYKMHDNVMNRMKKQASQSYEHCIEGFLITIQKILIETPT